jgi:hypothetical protein
LCPFHKRNLDHLPAFVVRERFANLLYDVVFLAETGAVFANFQNISVHCGHFYDDALHPFTFKTEAALARVLLMCRRIARRKRLFQGFVDRMLLILTNLFFREEPII